MSVVNLLLTLLPALVGFISVYLFTATPSRSSRNRHFEQMLSDRHEEARKAERRAVMKHECLSDEYLLTIQREGFIDHPIGCLGCIDMEHRAGLLGEDEYRERRHFSVMTRRFR